MAKDNLEPKTDVIAETDNYLAWKADEPDGETTFHLELNNVTLHFFQEEWDQFLELVQAIDEIQPDDDQFYRLEFDNVDVWMDEEDWREFKNLAKEISK